MKYSMNSFPFTSAISWLPVYTLEDTLAMIANAGFDAMELGCAAPHAWPGYMTKKRMQQISEAFKKTQLKCSSIVVPSGGGMGLNPGSPDFEERKACVDLNKRAVDMGEVLECPLILFVGGWYGVGVRKRDAWSYALEVLREIAEYAGKKNMTVCIEPTAEDSNVIESAEDALDMMRDVDVNNVKVMFDLEHILYRNESPLDYIRVMGENLRHVHITDISRTPPGSGDYDFLPVMQKLKDMGYQGYITLETAFGRKQRPDEAAISSLAYLKKIENMLK